ncbi:MAG: 50S ribosomal protein L4 [Armatimonadota bacterium]
MPQLALYDTTGHKVGEVEGDADVFGASLNRDLVHQAVMVVDGSRKQKCGRAQSRSEVSLTGAKMYRQKGLGRARHGARSAPIFVGGGNAFPPQGNRRVLAMPKKARQRALYSALSAMARKGKVMIIEGLSFEAPKTKVMVALLESMHVNGRILLMATRDEAVSDSNYKSARNIPGLVLRESPHLNTRDALWADYIIFTQGGLEALTGGGTADA